MRIKKLNSNYIPFSKYLADTAASGALKSLADTGGESLQSGSSGNITLYGISSNSNNWFGIAKGTTAERNSGNTPSTGALRFNTETFFLEVYAGNTWVSIGNSVGTAPEWVTESQNLGSYYSLKSNAFFSVEATGALDYEVTSGTLPSGLVLTANGIITGVANGTDVADYSNVDFTFSVTPIGEGNARGESREFTITIMSRYLGYLCATGGENTTLTVTAPTGMKLLRKDFSHYGTFSGSCGSFTRGGCSSTSAANWSPTLPATTVSFTASNATWGDPCSGTGKSGAIQLSYGPEF